MTTQNATPSFDLRTPEEVANERPVYLYYDGYGCLYWLDEWKAEAFYAKKRGDRIDSAAARIIIDGGLYPGSFDDWKRSINIKAMEHIRTADPALYEQIGASHEEMREFQDL